MTQILFKNDIDQNKIDVLLHLIKSWNIDAEVMPSASPKSRRKKNEPLTLAVGMWEGRDIDDRQLREKAWGTAKRAKQ
ncbi:MAG: hypothetical protein LBG47_08715 [Prevotellaceae bacterium]|jgi:hypothetical protein|nr:hypothetical protein [Prevotellaceae bacterium]